MKPWIFGLMFVISLLMLFVSMIFSAMAAGEAKKNNITLAYKYSWWSAVASGVSTAVVVMLFLTWSWLEKHVGASAEAANRYFVELFGTGRTSP